MNFLTSEMADDLNFIRSILIRNRFSNIRNITRLPGGSRSVAYQVNDKIVRFPKADIIWKTMQREKQIIDMIFPYLMPYFEGKIYPIDLIEDLYPFSVSKKFDGKICDGRPESVYAVLYKNLSLKQQEKLSCDLAMFFHLMHQIDLKELNIPEPTEAIDNWDITLREDFNKETAQNTLISYHIDLNNFTVFSPNIEKAICHNDLSGSNILLTPEKKDILSGIIDFGNVTVIPKYQDFFPLYKIDRQLALNTLKKYNDLTLSKIEPNQIDLMVLLYIGHGLSKDKDNPSPYFMKLIQPFL